MDGFAELTFRELKLAKMALAELTFKKFSIFCPFQ